MDPWVWWLVAAVALGVIEVVTGGTLVFLMLAAGAAAAAVVSAIGAPTVATLLTFAAVSSAAVLLVRPVARSHMRMPALTRTGIDALVGADALVLERVDRHDGRVKLGGEIWSARAYDGSSSYEPGSTVQVLRIDGATALVA